MKLVRRDPSKGYLSDWLAVPKRFINLDGTKNALTWYFTDHDENMKVVQLFQETDHHLLLPREFWKISSLPFEVVDCRPLIFKQSPVTSNIKLDHKKDRRTGQIIPTGKDVQRRSVDAMLKAQGGVLQLACGQGKTVVFLHLISLLRVPALIIVDTTTLRDQWLEEINWALNVPGGVGIIQAEKFDWDKWIVIATYHTIASRGKAGDFPEKARRHFGVIGWDEGHHISAPTFAPGAHLFYGKRFALTATPERDDGLHIIYNFHLGPVVYKNLSQDIKPIIVFRWTSCELDHTVPLNEVLDKNQQINRSKLAVWYAKWMKRIFILLGDAKEAVEKGRKVLLLSNSVDEAMNLFTIWTRGYPTKLYTDIPIPTSIEVGETLSPVFLTPREVRVMNGKMVKAEKELAACKKRLSSKALHPVKRPQVKERRQKLEAMIAEIIQTLKQVAIGKKINRELNRRQKLFREEVNAEATTGGILIHKLKPEKLKEFHASKSIVFASVRYGKEGLDDIALDTMMVSMPWSSKNGLQQIMGRPSRDDFIKQKPVLLVYEDNIPTTIGMCKKLRGHLSDWPIDENGPYDYWMFDHPHARG